MRVIENDSRAGRDGAHQAARRESASSYLRRRAPPPETPGPRRGLAEPQGGSQGLGLGLGQGGDEGGGGPAWAGGAEAPGPGRPPPPGEAAYAADDRPPGAEVAGWPTPEQKRLSEAERRLAELLATRDLLRSGSGAGAGGRRRAPDPAPLPDYMQ